MASEKLVDELAEARFVAKFLFDVLDDIDTVSDWAKGNNVAYRRNVERLHKRRFEVATTDGWNWALKDSAELAPVLARYRKERGE